MISAWLILPVLVSGLVTGHFLGTRQADRERVRLDMLVESLGILWARLDARVARALHDAFLDACPELHDDFHAAADEWLAGRDHAALPEHLQ